MKDLLLAFCGTAINTLLALIVLLTGAFPLWLASILIVSAAMSWLGVIATSAGNRRVGGNLVVAGALVFIPSGLLAIAGGRRMIAKADARDRRRARRVRYAS